MQIQTAEIVISEKLSARKVTAFVNELKSLGVLDSLTRSIDDNQPIDIDISKLEEETPDEEVDNDDTIEVVEETDETKFFIRQAEQELKRHFGRPVKITSGRRKNKVQIEFSDVDDLLTLLKEIEQPSRRRQREETKRK